MRLRTSRLFLLPIFFAAVPALPPAFAQSPSDASLEALNARVTELYKAGKYGDAIPLAEQYAAAVKSALRRERTSERHALAWQARLLQDKNRLSERTRALDAPRARYLR